MRFTSNAFIFSAVALLSLIIPVVNAVDVAVINSPSAGQKLNAFQLVDVTWYVVNPSTVLMAINGGYYLQDHHQQPGPGRC